MKDSFGFIGLKRELSTKRGKAIMAYGVESHKIWIGPSVWWDNTSKAFKRSIKVLIHETLHHSVNITEGEEACVDLDNIGFFDAHDPEFPYYGSSKGFRKKCKE
jgi:hypothetical protein